MISFDQEEVILPVVPLGMKSIGTFHVLNGGHDSLALQVHIHTSRSVYIRIRMSSDFGLVPGEASCR